MRTVLLFLAALTTASGAYAQDQPTPVPPREWFAVGGLITPALEGGGPWLIPAVRLSVPLGSRVGFDVDAGRIFGGTDQRWGSFRRFRSAQLRLMKRPNDKDQLSRYWLVGLHLLPEVEADGSRKDHTALAIGRGWSQTFPSGARLVTEAGFAGGDGFMVYANAGMQWGLLRR